MDLRITRVLLVAFIFLISMAHDASAQNLAPDPSRDVALHTPVQAFLNSTITAEQLEAELRVYTRAFTARPYKLGTAQIDWMKFPQERLFAFLRVTSRITVAAQNAFFKGEMTAAQAALQMAPFFLMWPGYGIDPPTGDPLARARADELVAEIGKYWATRDDVLFGHVAEGYASRQEGIGVNVASRMFSVPDNVCASAPRAAVLHASSDRIELQVGQPFPIDRLVIEARDESGRLQQGVPIAIEVEAIAPPLLNHRSDAMPENHLHPLRPGAFRVRARTICGETPIQVFMQAVIR